MLKERKIFFVRVFRFSDILIILSSFFLSYFLRFNSIDLSLIFHQTEYYIFFFTYLVAWLYISSLFKLYSSKRFTKFLYESLDVFKTLFFSYIIAMTPAFFIREDPLSRRFLIYFISIQFLLLIFFRFNLRLLLKRSRRQGYNYRNVLIVGKNARSEKICKKITSTPEYGIRIIGYMDFLASDVSNNHYSSCLEKFKLLGELSNLESILRKDVIDTVLITLPIKSLYSEIHKIIMICEEVGIEVELPVQLFNLKSSKSSLSIFDNVQLINFYTSPYKISWQIMLKRILDVSLSLALILLFIPLFLIISALIKITSPGPVLFKQRRVGYNGREFTLYKFRTMIQNAETIKGNLLKLNELDGPVFKIKFDPRITKIGKFLRKSSIDELPQLFNVLKGEMSLVGPRPPLPDEVVKYRLTDRRRLSIKPGITGLWQVSGRNQISFENWMELDRKYIDNWSLWLDFKILLKTIFVVIKGEGAY